VSEATGQPETSLVHRIAIFAHCSLCLRHWTDEQVVSVVRFDWRLICVCAQLLGIAFLFNMQVDCYYKHSTLSVDGVDNLVPLCSYLVTCPVTSAKLIDLFPFASDKDITHFRVKVSGYSLGLGCAEYVWLDLPYEDESLPLQDLLADSFGVDIQVVFAHADCDILFADNQSGVSNDQLATITRCERLRFGLGNQFDNRQESRQPAAIQSEADAFQANAAMKSVKKGASNLWNAVKSTAEKLQQATLTGLPSSTFADVSDNEYSNSMVALQNLSDLSTMLSTPYSDSTHRALLVRLFQFQCEGLGQLSANSVESVHWRTAGWQGTHPQSDLKTSGILAIHSMIYLSEIYPERARDMIARNRTNTKSQYPFAIVGVNLTLLLADILQLKAER
jgi:hypothetical protein